MSFTIFKLFLKQLARLTMSESEYAAFNSKMRYMEFHQLKQNFPSMWDQFTSTYETLQEEFAGHSPEEIANILIDHFESLGLDSIHSFTSDLANIGLVVDFDILNNGVEHVADMAHDVVGDVIDLVEGTGDVLEAVFDFVANLFG